MYVRAVSIGHAVPRTDFDAVVHSVFTSAVNLRLNGDGRLLTIVASGDDDLPQGIRLEPTAGFSFEALACGSEASCTRGCLRFNGYAWTIELQHAACWDETLPDLRADMQDARVMASWLCAWRALNERQLLQHADLVARELAGSQAPRLTPWVRQAGACLRDIMDATRQCRPAPVRALHGLVGLGPGLTPSGDDLLAGYLIGLVCAAQGRPERIDLLSRLGASVVRLSFGTNDISRTYLVHAAHGHASSRLLGLAGAVCRAEPEAEVCAAANAAMLLGHTSGTDAVTGLLAGLAVWDAPELVELQAMS